jgi:GDPmannose 4,6-dehydratase
MAKRALITGVNGQDGAYLARILLDKGYSVTGAVRRKSSVDIGRLAELGIANSVEFCDLELQEFGNIQRVIQQAKPDEIYNLAAQSFVALSFEEPAYTGAVDALGVTHILEAIRQFDKSIRYYQASTSEMFGRAREFPQSETTPFYPRSPYAIAKLYAHWMTINYRESYDLFAVSGILFNHESPLRGQQYVTRKITLGLAKIKHGQLDVLEVGNLDSKRDWGFAGDYVEGVWRMLQQDHAEDYVLATGETHSVREFASLAGEYLGFQIEWQGTGLDERGIDRKSGRTIVKVNPQFFRPAEVDVVCGNSAKAELRLGWKRKTAFPDLIAMMVEADERRARDRLFPV